MERGMLQLPLLGKHWGFFELQASRRLVRAMRRSSVT